ncbi:leucine-rich repeat extensin-like protein 5 [Penaeus chinensis]|uniref:leucine-rich repeat extensin-like protein 5 n=1 Tax=Penaeus chinensis TaxID=139456 RepID=UPI001FB580DE|nr:leucine-rich repeat extensin-like protein 5 [Penaeus chinensis]
MASSPWRIYLPLILLLSLHLAFSEVPLVSSSSSTSLDPSLYHETPLPSVPQPSLVSHPDALPESEITPLAADPSESISVPLGFLVSTKGGHGLLNATLTTSANSTHMALVPSNNPVSSSETLPVASVTQKGDDFTDYTVTGSSLPDVSASMGNDTFNTSFIFPLLSTPPNVISRSSEIILPVLTSKASTASATTSTFSQLRPLAHTSMPSLSVKTEYSSPISYRQDAVTSVTHPPYVIGNSSQSSQKNLSTNESLFHVQLSNIPADNSANQTHSSTQRDIQRPVTPLPYSLRSPVIKQLDPSLPFNNQLDPSPTAFKQLDASQSVSKKFDPSLPFINELDPSPPVFKQLDPSRRLVLLPATPSPVASSRLPPVFYSPPPLPPLPPTPSPLTSRPAPFTIAKATLPRSFSPTTSERPSTAPDPTTTPTPNPLDMPPHVLSLFLFLLSPTPPPLPSTSNSSTALPPVSALHRILSPANAFSQGCVPPEGVLRGRYSLSLTPQAGLQYGVFLASVPALDQFTVCMRFQVLTLARSHFLFSYAVQGQDNAILVFVSPGSKPGLGFYVNNVRMKANADIRVRTWYSMCASWLSDQGEYAIYLNGVKIKKGIKKCPGCEVESGGIAVLGLEQDRPGGGFNPGQVTHGHVTSLHVWNKALHDTFLHPYLCCSSGTAEVETSQVACEVANSTLTSHSKRVIEWGVTPMAVMGGALFVPYD